MSKTFEPGKVIDGYKLVAARETELRITIILKDDEPVFQCARRLSPSERDTVNEQIREWLRDGIVQHSLSEMNMNMNTPAR